MQPHPPPALERLAQPVQPGVVVLLREEAGLTVVAALHDMQRNGVKVEARPTGRDSL